MYVIDDTVLQDPGIDPYVLRAVRTLGMRGMRSVDGKVLFGAGMNGTSWIIVEPLGNPLAGAKEEVWVGGQVDLEGKGFRYPADAFHQAAVYAIRSPSPLYERGMDSGVLDATVGSEAEAKQMLVEALTAEPEMQPAYG